MIPISTLPPAKTHIFYPQVKETSVIYPLPFKLTVAALCPQLPQTMLSIIQGVMSRMLTLHTHLS